MFKISIIIFSIFFISCSHFSKTTNSSHKKISFKKIEKEYFSKVPSRLPANATSLKGEGTKESPYQLWTTEDVIVKFPIYQKRFRELELNAWNIDRPMVTEKYNAEERKEILKENEKRKTVYYKVMSSMDFGGVNFKPLILKSGSVFDGGKNVLKNITIVARSQDRIGFFSNTHRAEVKDIYLEGIHIVGHYYVGGLIGEATETQIHDSYAKGSVSGSAHSTGGLIGRSYNSNTAYSNFRGVVIGNDYTGGLIGDSYISEVKFSYAKGSVNGEKNTGGLIGDSREDNITLSHASEIIVKGVENTGGLIGNARASNLSLTYTKAKVAGNLSVGGLVGKISGYEISLDSNCDMLGESNTYPKMAAITSSYTEGSTSGNDNVGGIAGVALASKLFSNYSTGDVSGDKYAAALIGYLGHAELGEYDCDRGYDIGGGRYYSIVQHSYSTGSVTASNEKSNALIAHIDKNSAKDIEYGYDGKNEIKDSFKYDKSEPTQGVNKLISKFPAKQWSFRKNHTPVLKRVKGQQTHKQISNE